ncbi:MAG: Asp-tRNA(Asn)/Glu-tRNA(Gln) amidotransferase subunit GatA, partial [Bdellovibrionaceae bacterium]|nr:Asp-tRNA(Asn)/Glu-tRNA(Gln) amidotransferase subunit GatA [Pseudobdellovibrionaceae bacterium]
MDLLQADFSQVTEAVQNKKISAVETTQFFLDRIQKLDQQLNSFTHVSKTVLKEAELLDQKIARNENVGPLAGVVFGIKDLLCTKGMPSTAASKMLSGFIPPYDATVVSRLKNAGAIILGKLNQDEFAMGTSNETSVYGACHNPWDPSRVPGGSSGGSAAAQAARLAMATIGTDTGGSIRQPASFCGVVGV